MGDILSAASLLLAIVTVLYALWYQELISALQTEIPEHIEDYPKPLAALKNVLFSRAIPLFLSSVTVSFVFLPDATGRGKSAAPVSKALAVQIEADKLLLYICTPLVV